MGSIKQMIDLNELRQALRTMRPRTKLFEVVRSELMAQGRWKRVAGGKPFQAGADKRRKDIYKKP